VELGERLDCGEFVGAFSATSEPISCVLNEKAQVQKPSRAMDSTQHNTELLTAHNTSCQPELQGKFSFNCFQ
jgi:hypothetical protein